MEGVKGKYLGKTTAFPFSSVYPLITNLLGQLAKPRENDLFIRMKQEKCCLDRLYFQLALGLL